LEKDENFKHEDKVSFKKWGTEYPMVNLSQQQREREGDPFCKGGVGNFEEIEKTWGGERSIRG